MSWEHGAGFRVTGVVTRAKVFSPKFAVMTVEVPNGRGGQKKVDMRAFSDAIDQVQDVGQGQVVQVTGTVDMEKLTSKDRNEVKVDGFAKWVPALTIRKVEVEPSSAKPKPSAAPTGDGWD
jgi:hypothetical protein